MTRSSWNTVFIFAVLIGLSPAALVSRSTDEMWQRQAVEAPAEARKSIADQDEGDEIDNEIDRYFAGVSENKGVDVDERKLEQIFGPSRSIDNEAHGDEHGEDGSFSFANRGNLEDDDLVSHKVVAGDTIWGLSKKFDIKPEQVVQHNPELRKRPLYIGEEILIIRSDDAQPVKAAPKISYHKVQKGDTLSEIARRHRVSVSALQKWNGMGNGSVIRIGQNLKVVKGTAGPPSGYRYARVFEWPLRGTITSGYGRRSNPFVRSRRQYHRGIDIGAAMGTPVRAARDGVVIMSRRMGGYGNCIFVRHSDGYVSVYAHLMLNKVREGEVVKLGQVIGKVGRTGTATGPHLHFEVRKWKKAINPISALRMQELVPNEVASRR